MPLHSVPTLYRALPERLPNLGNVHWFHLQKVLGVWRPMSAVDPSQLLPLPSSKTHSHTRLHPPHSSLLVADPHLLRLRGFLHHRLLPQWSRLPEPGSKHLLGSLPLAWAFLRTSFYKHVPVWWLNGVHGWSSTLKVSRDVCICSKKHWITLSQWAEQEN